MLALYKTLSIQLSIITLNIAWVNKTQIFLLIAFFVFDLVVSHGILTCFSVIFKVVVVFQRMQEKAICRLQKGARLVLRMRTRITHNFWGPPLAVQPSLQLLTKKLGEWSTLNMKRVI